MDLIESLGFEIEEKKRKKSSPRFISKGRNGEMDELIS